MTFLPTWLMIKRHSKTGLLYFCKTTKADPYKYKGSGIRWGNHMKAHGRDVDTIWCKQFTDAGTLMYFAIEFSIRNKIVEYDEWANLVVEDGITGWPPGTKHKESSVEKCRINADGFKKGCIPHNKGKSNSEDHYARQIAGQIKYRQENSNWAEAWQEGRRKAEPRRIDNMKKRLTGSGNHNYDPTIYTFVNKKTKQHVSTTRNEFIKTYNCPAQNIYKLVKGERKSVAGWTLTNLVTI
jgi:hypothetical protein